MFEIREVEGKGKGIVATCAIKAGAIVLREKPLMKLTTEFQKRYEGCIQPDCEHLLAALSTFRKKMTAEEQQRFLSLHGGEPGNSPRAEYMRALAINVYTADGPTTAEKAELYARIFLVQAYNAFGGNNGKQVYEVASRFCHSCESNCSYTIDGDDIVVRTLTPILEGEELTLDYNTERRLEPTHFRRFKWVQVKDFTCHCPRCNAEGDDTRQFNCFDARCTGYHLACQPLNKDSFELPGLGYIGVE